MCCGSLSVRFLVASFSFVALILSSGCCSSFFFFFSNILSSHPFAIHFTLLTLAQFESVWLSFIQFCFHFMCVFFSCFMSFHFLSFFLFDEMFIITLYVCIFAWSKNACCLFNGYGHRGLNFFGHISKITMDNMYLHCDFWYRIVNSTNLDEIPNITGCDINGSE